MANFILSYDLNGRSPTHQQMDEHLKALGPTFVLGRVLETVWYLAGPATAIQLREYAQRILSQNDLLLVAEVSNVAWTKLLVDGAAFKARFEASLRKAAA